MYETFFQMEHTPFSRNTPVADLYESPAMADTLGRLAYAADRQLFAVVTADAGCGKSTLIRRFVTSLPKEEYLFLYLSDSKLTPRWFYKGMLDQLGIESKFYRGDAKRQLQKEVEIIRGVQKKKVVCILDEAHLLEKETIEEFRFLLNYRFDSISPMALVLVGQTELWDKLRMQRYAAVRQRIDINCVLPHLCLLYTSCWPMSWDTASCIPVLPARPSMRSFSLIRQTKRNTKPMSSPQNCFSRMKLYWNCLLYTSPADNGWAGQASCLLK